MKFKYCHQESISMNQEVVNYLLAYENMKIIQRKDMFNFSLDTVLLAHFCTKVNEFFYINKLPLSVSTTFKIFSISPSVAFTYT